MRIEEEKEVTSIQEVITGYECDQCGLKRMGKSIPDNWHEFSSSHQSWGNDSCDSVKWHIGCSPACFVEKLRFLNTELEDEDVPEVSDMSFGFSKDLVAFITALAKMEK